MAGRKPRPDKKPQMLKLSNISISLIKGAAKQRGETLSDIVEDMIMNHFADISLDEYAGTGHVVGVDMDVEFAAFGPYYIMGRHSRAKDWPTIDPDSPYVYFVLHVEDGEYAGKIFDGSDCAFGTLEEAFAYMKKLILAAREGA